MNNYKDLNDYEVMYMIGEGSNDAFDLLFEKYQPVINKLAREYYKYGKKYGLEYQDFVQEGCLGLNLAIKNYTDNKNALFYTYAIVCIRSRMGNLIKRSDTKKSYILNNSVSLYSTIDGTDKELIDYISDRSTIIPDNETEYNELINLIKDYMYKLDVDKASVLELKYNGFNNKEIARLLGMNPGQISYISNFIRKNLNYYR